VPGGKIPLSIYACTVSKDGKITAGSKPQFQALINPSGYGHEFQIKYSKNAALGQAGNETKYSASLPEKLSLKELVFDGTGVVPNTTQSVTDQVTNLRATVYDFNTERNEAPIVKVVWGDLLFYGRADGFKVDYTLFKPTGEPLRARVTLNFIEYKNTEELVKIEQQKKAGQMQSEVMKENESLEAMCLRIYDDPELANEVARLNGLTSKNAIPAGKTVYFPPLK
jgi:hypothetical protein